MYSLSIHPEYCCAELFLNQIYDMIWYDIFVNCNWVATWWQ